MNIRKSVEGTGQSKSSTPVSPPPNINGDNSHPPPSEAQLIYRLAFLLIFAVLAITLLMPFVYPHEAARLIEKFWTFIFGLLTGLIGGIGIARRKQ